MRLLFMSTEDLVPSRQVIDAVINNTILPILKQLEEELGKFVYRLSVFVDNEERSFQLIDLYGEQKSSALTQPIRIRFRPTFNSEQLKFQVEAVFSKDISPEGTGFSGFWTKGKVNTDNLNVPKTPWVAQYNVWQWRGWK